eukprot:scaffold148_cov243-Pinguiococcus_pyrenoidosus.AAC.3
MTNDERTIRGHRTSHARELRSHPVHLVEPLRRADVRCDVHAHTRDAETHRSLLNCSDIIPGRSVKGIFQRSRVVARNVSQKRPRLVAGGVPHVVIHVKHSTTGREPLPTLLGGALRGAEGLRIVQRNVLAI